MWLSNNMKIVYTLHLKRDDILGFIVKTYSYTHGGLQNA